MCNSGALILIGTEQVRSKRIFTYLPTVFYTTFRCYFYTINVTNYYTNPPLIDLCINLSRLTVSTSFQ